MVEPAEIWYWTRRQKFEVKASVRLFHAKEKFLPSPLLWTTLTPRGFPFLPPSPKQDTGIWKCTANKVGLQLKTNFWEVSLTFCQIPDFHLTYTCALNVANLDFWPHFKISPHPFQGVFYGNSRKVRKGNDGENLFWPTKSFLKRQFCSQHKIIEQFLGMSSFLVKISPILNHGISRVILNQTMLLENLTRIGGTFQFPVLFLHRQYCCKTTKVFKSLTQNNFYCQ